MTDIDTLSARMVALETVVAQLMTHLAVRADDPAEWVATRRTLALHAVQGHAWYDGHTVRAHGLERAIAGLFDQVETVVAKYGVPLPPRRNGTPRHSVR